jgi:hypothetical protein
LPVAPPGELAVADVSERIFTSPDLRSRGSAAFCLAVATQDGLARQFSRRLMIAAASPLASALISATSSSRSRLSVVKNRASQALIARNSTTPTTISATRFRTAGSRRRTPR